MSKTERVCLEFGVPEIGRKKSVKAKCKRCKLIKRWECQKVYEKTRAFYSIKQIEDLIST